MERLTEQNWRNLDPWECCGQDHYCQRGCHDLGGCTGGCIVPKLYTRLAAYEGTGLEPEEVIQTKLALMGKVLAEIKEFEGIPADRMIELAQAEKDGRLVVLQEGVTVRRLQEEYRKAKHMADERLPSPDYTTGCIAGFGAGVVHILDKILTREEAEAAQKKREEADNEI